MDLLQGALCACSPPSSWRAPLNPGTGLLGHCHPPRHRTPPPPSTRPGDRPRGRVNTTCAHRGLGARARTEQADAVSRCRDGLRREGGTPAQDPGAHRGPSDGIQGALPSPQPPPRAPPTVCTPHRPAPASRLLPGHRLWPPLATCSRRTCLKAGLGPSGSCSPRPPPLSSTSRPQCRGPSIPTKPTSPRPFPACTSTLLALETPAHQGSRPRGWALTESELPSTLDSHLRPPGSRRPLPGPAQRWCSSHLKAVAGRQPSLEGQDPLQGPGTLAGPGRPQPDSAQGGTASPQQSWAPASSLPAGRRALPAQSAFQGSGARPPPSSHPGQPGFVTSQAEVTRGQCWAFHTSRCRPSLARRLPAAQSRTMSAGPRGGGM